MVHLVIPMAGLGSRFSSAGYKDPKPLLPVHQSRMFEIVVSNLFSEQLSSITLVSPTRFEVSKELASRGNSIAGVPAEAIEIDHVTDGPARTVLIGLTGLPGDEPVVIANSDQYIDFSAQDLYQRLISTRTGGIIVAMEDDDPKWSYAVLGASGFVQKVVEKQVVSKYATAGIYGFTSVNNLRNAIHRMETANDRTNGELYVGPAFNYLENSVGNAEILNLGPVGEVMHGLGIPEDYESFVRNELSVRASNLARELFGL